MTNFTEFGEGMLFAADIDTDGPERVVPGGVFGFCSPQWQAINRDPSARRHVGIHGRAAR
ncbi:hypothetical protein [Paraburkholderia strydomiana]|uniref:hypothetical protein n=1 Tax=Paraburkholderia strydomiana TaxID=1245417 RepID=UPI002860A766|nr:hypothetical protein [Paraburkholderia strydomiana]MDR7009966.1 hypothetical protein [Paraburkholderia strydomiana]